MDKPLDLAVLDELERSALSLAGMNANEWEQTAIEIVAALPELLRLARAQLQLPAEVVLMRDLLLELAEGFYRERKNCNCWGKMPGPCQRCRAMKNTEDACRAAVASPGAGGGK